jgi:outer membrane protein TolC
LGPFLKLNIKIIQPLLTFGRKSAAKSAARSGIDLQNIQSRSEIETLTLKVIEAYWALNAAREAVSISKEVTENYNKLVKEVKKRLDTEDSEVDDTDLLEVKSNRYQIEEIHIKSQAEQKIAQRLFNLVLGRDQIEPANVSGGTTPTLMETETQLTQKIRQVLSRHGDIKGLQAAVKGLQAQSKLAVSKKRPVIFLAGGFGYGYAPGREDQTNPFAVDGYNYTDLGVFVGFQWDLNSFRKNVEAKRYQLEKKAMEQNMKLLRAKIEMEILKTYTEVKQNTQLLEQAKKSLKSAKSWLRLSMDNWEMGIGEVERLIKAYNAYYQLKGVEIKRTLELNISLANFAYRLGNTKQYLEWVKNGNVKIY